MPIDIISAEEFRNQGSTDALDQLRVLVPSFNVSTIPIDDAASLIRPANLRGLPPDNTLVLVNGKRFHRSAVITFLGHGLSDGSQGPDLSVFPSLALEQVEVLRGGGGHGDLDVVLRALGEEALDPGRRVLWALALVAVG